MPERQEPLVATNAAESKVQIPQSPVQTGVRDELLRLTTAASELLAARFGLAQLEFQEAQKNIQKRLTWTILALFFISLAFLAGNVLLLATYWHTPLRDQILWWAIGGYAVIGLFALWRLFAAKRQSSSLFAASIAEFGKDRQWLKNAQKSQAPKSDTPPSENLNESKQNNA